jgi:DNA-binding FadR family transcriptional regulator
MKAEAAVRPRFSARARMEGLQEEIIDLILDRGLEPGDPLPTEHELCAELGVGRNTAREALKVLQAVEIIEIRHGFGMFVAQNSLDALARGLAFRNRLSLRHSGDEALELVDVCQMLEAGLIAAATDAMTESHLTALRETVERMEKLAEAGESIAEEEQLFHGRLFEPLENGLLANLMGVFWQVYRQLHDQVAATGLGLGETARRHREIYEAVAAGDKVQAAKLIGCNFDGIRELIRERVSG